MEFIIEEIRQGQILFILSVLERQGCRIFITAKDADNRRIWKTPLMDDRGNIKVYQNAGAAVTDAKNKIPSLKPGDSD
jgi:hypothetical protein